MRTALEVEQFKVAAQQRFLYGCKKCHGSDKDCTCHRKTAIKVAAYEAGIPGDFWDIKAKDVSHNKKVFKKIIHQYVLQLPKALKNGYGLVLFGANGVGKSYFLSYILMTAIRQGRTAYYTTLPQLVHDVKKGFHDSAVEKRIDWFLTSDFVAIDEMGKEKFSTGKYKDDFTFMDTQVERVLKQRFDDGHPTLLATNLGQESLYRAYGTTVGSIMAGKYKPVALKDGDYRKRLAKNMNEKMGY